MATLLLRSEIKIEEVCRTCLAKATELYSVFDECFGTDTLDRVIAAVTGLKFQAGDGLPSTVCRNCKERATNAYYFKCRSLEVDETLRRLLSVKREVNVTDKTVYQPHVPDVKAENDFPVDIPDDYNMDLDFHLPGASEREAQTHLDEFEGAPIYCIVCAKIYEDAESLTRHMWRRHPDVMGPKKPGRPKQLLTHAVLKELFEPEHKDLQWYPCILCRAQVTSREELSLHMVQHKDEKVLSCTQCKKMYLKKTDFDQHHCGNRETDQQQEIEPLQSQPDVKPERSATEVLLQEFLMSNNDKGEGLHVCGSCGGVFSLLAELAEHRDKDHPDQSLRCEHCHKVFASLRGAARHRGTCALIERSFSCDSCGEKFRHEITLNKHILRYHAGHPVSIRFETAAPSETADGGADTHTCETCDRTFCRKELLTKHIKLHKPGDKCFECDICNKKFHRRNNLRSHMRTHEVRPTSGASSACLCLYCGRGFSNSSNLIVHMRRHTGEKPYKCDFCGKGFPRSSDLQCHRRSHTGEKPCVCGVCGKGFSRSNKLSRHMRVHTGLKPYKCSYCDKAFSQSNDLTLHVRRHTGDKPYVCEICGDRFIQGTALHNHRRAHGHYPTAHISDASPNETVTTVNSPTETITYSTLALAN